MTIETNSERWLRVALRELESKKPDIEKARDMVRAALNDLFVGPDAVLLKKEVK